MFVSYIVFHWFLKRRWARQFLERKNNETATIAHLVRMAKPHLEEQTRPELQEFTFPSGVTLVLRPQMCAVISEYSET